MTNIETQLATVVAERDKLRALVDNIMGYDRPELFEGWSESDSERYAQQSPVEMFNQLRALEARLDSQKSRKFRYEMGFLYQAERVEKFILIKHFSSAKRQNHMDIWFHVSHWPANEHDQIPFISMLLADQALTVFNEDFDAPIFAREAEAIAKGIREVLA